MKLGRELRHLRKSQRLTLVEVSSETKLSVSYLSDIERGRTKPSLTTLEKLAACYRVSVNDILEETDLAASISERRYPPGFESFMEEMGEGLDEEIEDLLLRAETRSKRKAQTKEDWKKLYYSLIMILGE